MRRTRPNARFAAPMGRPYLGTSAGEPLMRRLMLLRHAKSDWSAGGQRDLDRILAPRGREVTPVIARYMVQHGLVADRVLVSHARRTRETWELLAPEFPKQPPFAYEPRLYEAAAKALLAVVRETASEVHTLLLVGHNPGLQELAAVLTGSGDAEARHRLMEKFPTAALAVLDFAIDDWSGVKPSSGRLDRFVTPRALKLACD
jgi:phosphohistidine phosphatase